MESTFTKIIGCQDCRYKFRGVNLVNYRRGSPEIDGLAKALDLFDPSLSKNEILTRIIRKADMMQLEEELSDMVNGL